MDRPIRAILANLVAFVVLGACASPTAPAASGGSPASAAQSELNRTRTLVFNLKAEPATLTARVTSGGETGQRTALFTGGLVYSDDENIRRAMLAVAPPELNTSSWRVFPDGRMETTYRLRPNLTWHDGVPLSAKDFVFARRVVTDPSGTVFTLQPEDKFIEEVVAPDPLTVVIRWRGLYRDAGKLRYDPLPRHILQRPFEDLPPDGFGALRYWTSEFVHLGPYRVARWEQGAFIEAESFAGFALGQPKIRRVKLTWSGDPSVVVANLLSGAADTAQDSAITFQEAITLKRAWADNGAGRVILNPSQIRYIKFQHRPEYAQPASITDIRVRTAIAHSVDKKALSDALLEGEGSAADSFVAPLVDFHDVVDRAVAKYPYDPRRTAQLMAEAGYTRGSDGVYTRPDGRFAPELRGFGPSFANEVAVLADAWRRQGFEVSENIIPTALFLDGAIRSTFPALSVDFFGANGADGSMNFFLTSAVPAANNGWVGNNRGGYSNPEFDRLNQAFNAALDDANYFRLAGEVWRVLSVDVGAVPMYYNYSLLAYVSNLSGPRTTPIGGSTYSGIYRWEWTN